MEKKRLRKKNYQPFFFGEKGLRRKKKFRLFFFEEKEPIRKRTPQGKEETFFLTFP
ncbi:MAG: hypothetical protein MJ070_06430 [Lachnospiraceae bacterium]|nr:hypothetical protein [Lachnospiraceae bacterium]